MKPAKPADRKRFYKDATVAEGDGGGFEVHLDGRSVKTPAGRKLAVPARALAEAIAEEWNAQGDSIVLATLPLTKLANSAIDGVAGREADVVDDIVKYAGTDLLCYRASFPEELVARQADLWDPILAWVQAKYNAPFLTTTGVQHLAQPVASLDAIRIAISGLDAFRLAALHVMTSLTGSALISLAHIGGLLDTNAAWTASRVDENWQSGRWGEDFDAAQKDKARFAEFENASRFFNFSSGSHPE
jgi:chaperone required for assembly of F1-ATPase